MEEKPKRTRRKKNEPFAEGLSEAFCLETLRFCQDAVDYYGTTRRIEKTDRDAIALETAEELLKVTHQTRYDPALCSWARYCSIVCYSAVTHYVDKEARRHEREEAFASGLRPPVCKNENKKMKIDENPEPEKPPETEKSAPRRTHGNGTKTKKTRKTKIE